jgi:very-short-patch-repair endonuclease
LTASQPKPQPNGNYSKEWGGLYLRSEAEVRVAEALDRAEVLFFANARGRVGLQDTCISTTQLTGRVEVDFLIFHQGKCISLEVDGQHHLAQEQSIRDYARDRVLLRSGVLTVRFTAKDCLERAQQVVSEILSILKVNPAIP